MNKLFLIDCMEYMKTCEDNAFDLAIVDPPYGIDCGDQRRQKSRSKLAETIDYHYSGWDKIPADKKYFDEIFRISKNQIIWGYQYFGLPATSCVVVWNKENGKTGFADCELAWANFDTAVRMFTFRWSGMLQGNMKTKEKRIHPTQKPVVLYKWLLQNYANSGDKLFDSHSGSGSFRIAAHDLGFDLVSCEIDSDYYRDNEARFQNHIKQSELFDKSEYQDIIYDR